MNNYFKTSDMGTPNKKTIAEEYLFYTWVEPKTIIETEKGTITVIELLEAYTKHLNNQ